jgi:hypothetical protein
LELGNKTLEGEIVGVNGKNIRLLIKTTKGYVFETVKKPNIDGLSEISQMIFIGNDEEYLYYQHGDKYFGKKLENAFDVNYDFLDLMEEVNLNMMIVGDHYITNDAVIGAILLDGNTTNYTNDAVISKNKNVYTVHGISIFGGALDRFIENINIPAKTVKITKIDLDNKTIDVDFNGKIETLPLKNDVTFESFKLDSSKYKLSESVINTALATKIKKLASSLDNVLQSRNLSFEKILKISVDEAINRITSDIQLTKIVERINQEFEN